MYIRILKRRRRYVAEIIQRAMIDDHLQALCLKLGNMGIKKGMIIYDNSDAFEFNAFEKRILRDFLPD